MRRCALKSHHQVFSPKIILQHHVFLLFNLLNQFTQTFSSDVNYIFSVGYDTKLIYRNIGFHPMENVLLFEV